MARLTVTDEQARRLAQAKFPLILTDPQGRLISSVTPLPEEDAVDVEQALKSIEPNQRDPRESMTVEQLFSCF